MTCRKEFNSHPQFQACPADGLGALCSLGRGFHSCSPLDTTAAPSGWLGAAGSNPEHVLPRHIPADRLETTALQQLLPCELL